MQKDVFMQLKEVESMWNEVEKTLKGITFIEKYLSDAREVLIHINNLQMKSKIFPIDTDTIKGAKMHISNVINSIEKVIDESVSI